MKHLIAGTALIALAACGAPSGGGGVGFSNGPGKAAAPTATTVSTASAHDRLLSTVKPSVLAKMRSAEPVKVYTASSNLSRAEMASLNAAAQDAIVAGLPKPSFWHGYSKSHVSFRAGLVGGQVARVRIDGQGFAHLLSGTFIPKNRDQIYALIAHRSGCKWNGRAAVKSRAYPGTPGRVPTWFVGMNC